MAHLIRDRKLVDDTYSRVDDDAEIPEDGDIIVSLDRYLEARETLTERDDRLGVVVPSDGDVHRLEGALDAVDLVAVDFPKFADGRGYSHARILREQLGWEGPMRAVGDVLHDQLWHMMRCGFDEFALREDKDPQFAIEKAFSKFSVVYQPATDEREAVLQP